MIYQFKDQFYYVDLYRRNMLDKFNLDDDEIINSKMDQNEKKYLVVYQLNILQIKDNS